MKQLAPFLSILFIGISTTAHSKTPLFTDKLFTDAGKFNTLSFARKYDIPPFPTKALEEKETMAQPVVKVSYVKKNELLNGHHSITTIKSELSGASLQHIVFDPLRPDDILSKFNMHLNPKSAARLMEQMDIKYYQRANAPRIYARVINQTNEMRFEKELPFSLLQDNVAKKPKSSKINIKQIYRKLKKGDLF